MIKIGRGSNVPLMDPETRHASPMGAGFSEADEPGPLLQVRRIGRAFADITRVRLLSAMRNGEICVCHFETMLGYDPATVKRHLKLLREAGLVAARRENGQTWVRRVHPEATIWSALDEMCEGSAELLRDAEFLSRVGPCG